MIITLLACVVVLVRYIEMNRLKIDQLERQVEIIIQEHNIVEALRRKEF